jgi:hydroxyacylglutathione hydrolase
VPFITHQGEIKSLLSVPAYAPMMGITPPVVKPPDKTVDEPDEIEFGNTKLKVLFTPGHSAAHICFYCEKANLLVAGDVLFKGSIGRTDLPGGDRKTLMESIFNKLITLPDKTKVYPGHMENTTIGDEKRTNPFIRAWQQGERIF